MWADWMVAAAVSAFRAPTAAQACRTDPHFIKSGHCILYEFVFERLGLDRAVMDVVESNRKVRRFHAAYGAEPIDAPLRYADEEQSDLKLVWLGFAKDKWAYMKSAWTPILKAFCS